MTEIIPTSVTTRRIKQVTVTWKDSGAQVSLELGSLLEAAETVLAQQIKRLLPGQQSLS